MLPLLEKILAVKKPASGLPGSLLAQYNALAESAGFSSEPLEKGLLLTGKTVKLALKIEFGNRWEFFNTITYMREIDADIKIIITSSNSKSMRMETVYTVLKKKLEEKSRWAIVDIEGKKEPMFINFSLKDLGHYAGEGGSRPKPACPSSPRSQTARPSHSVSPAPISHSRTPPDEKSASRPRKSPSSPKESGVFGASPKSQERPQGIVQSIFDKARMTLSKYSGGPNPVLLKKTKNYGMQPANAPPRRKKIYGKRKKKRD